MKTAMPAYTNDVDLYPDMDKKWGLSFLINTAKTPEGRSPGSLAWAGLANTYFWIDPARNVSGVILMQLLPFAESKCAGGVCGIRARRLCRARCRQRTEGGVKYSEGDASRAWHRPRLTHRRPPRLVRRSLKSGGGQVSIATGPHRETGSRC